MDLAIADLTAQSGVSSRTIRDDPRLHRPRSMLSARSSFAKKQRKGHASVQYDRRCAVEYERVGSIVYHGHGVQPASIVWMTVS
jgi:hypothetical protein